MGNLQLSHDCLTVNQIIKNAPAAYMVHGILIILIHIENYTIPIIINSSQIPIFVKKSIFFCNFSLNVRTCFQYNKINSKYIFLLYKYISRPSRHIWET